MRTDRGGSTRTRPSLLLEQARIARAVEPSVLGYESPGDHDGGRCCTGRLLTRSTVPGHVRVRLSSRGGRGKRTRLALGWPAEVGLGLDPGDGSVTSVAEGTVRTGAQLLGWLLEHPAAVAAGTGG